MPLSVSIALGATPQVIAGRATDFVATITNTNASSVTLSSLTVSESTESDAQIAQPVFVTPNMPVGLGNPVLAPGTSTSFPFQVVFMSPYAPGSAPQNQPGGTVPGQPAFPADAIFSLQATAQTSDGSVFSSSLIVPALSTIAAFPVAQGGAFQFGQGANLVNLLTITGA